mmetsp:Transcript_34148/g.77938  ORF Transcript_34148/g.77938 Transcript_34148/m.77938 type:complete len:441 (+) Transcript_34148:74-1396(+)
MVFGELLRRSRPVVAVIAITCAALCGHARSESTLAFEKRLASIRRCVADGRILDLTAGTPGQPSCVDECRVEIAERVVQAEGMAICLQPVIRAEPLDIAFTLMLRGVPWDQVPKPIAMRSILMAVAQALQVAPSEIHSQVLVRDADIYEDYEIAAFEIRRQGEEYRRIEDRNPGNQHEAHKSNGTDTVLQLNSSEVAVADLPRMKQEELWRSPQQKRDEFLSRSRFRTPCRNCDVFVAMRCEAWRIRDLAGAAESAHPLLRVLQKGEQHMGEVEQQLGVTEGWQVMQANVQMRSLDKLPLEAVRTLPAFRYVGYSWDQDPLQEARNGTKGGPGHPFLIDGDFNGITQQSFGLGGPLPTFERAMGQSEVLPAELFVMSMVFIGLYAATRTTKGHLGGMDSEMLFSPHLEAALRTRGLRMQPRVGRRPGRNPLELGRELWDM